MSHSANNPSGTGFQPVIPPSPLEGEGRGEGELKPPWILDIDAANAALLAISAHCIYYLNGQCWEDCEARKTCPRSWHGDLVGGI